MRLRSNAEALFEVLRSRRQFRRVDRRGRFTRVTAGRVSIHNAGSIELGERVRFMCEYGTTDIRVGPGGVLRIGERTAVNYGSDFQVGTSVVIGERVSIGPRCIIADTPYSVPEDPRSRMGEPIVVEDGAWLATRVTLLPGSRVGAGSVVTAGSVVSGSIPPGVLAGGTPARVLRSLDETDSDGDGDGDRARVDPAIDHGFSPSMPTDAPAQVPPPNDASDAATEAVAGLLISDFTIDPLSRTLAEIAGPHRFTAEVAPFGAVVPTLLDPPAAARTDFAVVWTRPHAVLPSFLNLLDATDVVTSADIERDVDQFAGLIAQGLAHVDNAFVMTWTLPPWTRGIGLADLRSGGVRWALGIANVRLIEALAPIRNVVVLDAQRWVATVGETAYSERLWFLGKIPFSDAIWDLAATEINDAMRTLRGGSRKLLVLDLDNTMWGGVVGDTGRTGLRLGGHDAAGEAFVEFQRAVRRLQRRGVALAVVSKNDEHVALDAIDHHPEMVLRRHDFVGWRINWDDKAKNIVDLVADLNLGLQSVVFIDDNPHERHRVRSALPDVYTPDWPTDPIDYVKALESLTCFDTAGTTVEDRARTTMYLREGERQSLRDSIGDLDAWIRDLGVTVRVEHLTEANLARAAQLLNKTNQMNLSTRRLSERELIEWADEPGCETLCISVSDRLGEAGLTGIVSLHVSEGTATLVDFVLSCRVMGRRIEESLTYIAATRARQLGASSLHAEFRTTEKNEPCRRFLERSAFEQCDHTHFRLDVHMKSLQPADVDIIMPHVSSSAS